MDDEVLGLMTLSSEYTIHYTGESGLVYRGCYDGRMGKELVAVKTCKGIHVRSILSVH